MQVRHLAGSCHPMRRGEGRGWGRGETGTGQLCSPLRWEVRQWSVSRTAGGPLGTPAVSRTSELLAAR